MHDRRGNGSVWLLGLQHRCAGDCRSGWPRSSPVPSEDQLVRQNLPPMPPPSVHTGRCGQASLRTSVYCAPHAVMLSARFTAAGYVVAARGGVPSSAVFVRGAALAHAAYAHSPPLVRRFEARSGAIAQQRLAGRLHAWRSTRRSIPRARSVDCPQTCATAAGRRAACAAL